MGTVVYALVGQNIYNLTDGSISWRIADDNLASPTINRLEENGPLQHGVTDLGFRLGARIFHLTLKTQGTTMATLINQRKQLIDIFKPVTATPIKLLYVFDNGDQRQIDCYATGDSAIKMDEQDREGYMQTAVITLKAPDPCFYDPIQQSVTFGNPVAGGLQIPMGVAVTIGQQLLNQITPINYMGTFISYPVITIQGPITSPIISNLTTGENISFYGLISGTAIIDCRPGYKTVTDGNGNNLFYLLSDNTNLATFHLEPSPVAYQGNNLFYFYAVYVNASSAITVNWYSRYLGV
jgi:hypothetical protein